MQEGEEDLAADVVAASVGSRQCTSSSPPPARSIRPLRQDFSEQRILVVLVYVMHPNMSGTILSATAMETSVWWCTPTSASCPGEDTYALCPDKKDRRIRAIHAPDRV